MSRDEQIKKLAEEMGAAAMPGTPMLCVRALLPYAAESIRKDEAIAALEKTVDGLLEERACHQSLLVAQEGEDEAKDKE